MRMSGWSSDVCSSDLGPGGRLVTRFADGEEWEIGAVRRWSPGEYLAFGWRLPSFAAAQATEVEIRFEAVGDETRVTVEHRGWDAIRSEEHTSELQSLMRISYAVFCLQKKTNTNYTKRNE